MYIHIITYFLCASNIGAFLVYTGHKELFHVKIGNKGQKHDDFLFYVYRKKMKFYASSNDPDMNWDPKEAPKLDFNEDLYSVLEVKPDCTPQELKKKYLKLVFMYHPDKYEFISYALYFR